MFLKTEADVAFTYVESENVADQIVSSYKGGYKLRSFQVNLSKPSEIENAVKEIIKNFGTIDILVNNAGIWKEAAIDKMSLEEWNETMDVGK